jgi:D-alanyl-lipoteichoic acid acyltransferase DltB (MBOAT superfamily)
MAFLPIYILILGFTIVVDYFAGIEIEKSKGKRRKMFLIFSLIANIGILAVFKYYNFLNGNISTVLNTFGYHNYVPNLSILLPIGLSFHTFQAMSYTIEVYRGNFKAEKNFGIYSLYVMFYPQLVAGPIERPQNILHQFYEKHKFSYNNVTNGLKLIAWGFFKKIVIGDHLGGLVDQVYDNPHSFQGIPLIIATVFFAFQIYCDFSGYSDIAIGTARVMGFDLMENFNRPYFARSISEFWHRWHISLSTWFRDYLYIPLGGNRVSKFRRYFNLFFTFLISGLWHGASWTFLVWGGLNGLFQILDIATKKTRLNILQSFPAKTSKLVSVVSILFTFILVCLTWIFFRATTIIDGIYILTHSISLKNTGIAALLTSQNVFDIAFSIFGLFILLSFEYMQGKDTFINYINKKPKYYRWGFYYALIMIVLVLGKFDSSQKFIYFQF